MASGDLLIAFPVSTESRGGTRVDPDELRFIRHRLWFSELLKEDGMGVAFCVVCGGRAEKAYPVGSFDDFKCPDCGYYSVNRTLLEEMAASRQVFHVERTRRFLAVNSASGGVPAIDRLEATKHQLITGRTSRQQ